MALKDEWKDTGKGIGSAFKNLGKNIIRSAKTGVDGLDGTIDNAEVDENGNKRTVFNDGSWRETGKALGGAAKDLGMSILHSAKKGIDAIDDATKDDKPKETIEVSAEDISDAK